MSVLNNSFKVGSVYTLNKNLAISIGAMNGIEINKIVEYNKNSCFDVISINEQKNKITVEFEVDYSQTVNNKDIHITMNINELANYTKELE